MIEFTVGGRKIRPEDFGKELENQAATQIAENLHAQLSSIRLPSTGEFPTVVAIAESLQHMDIRAEGSPELIALIRERMSEEDLQHVTLREIKKTPSAFLSYGWEDSELAKRIATALQANGIDTWWAEWSIHPGDSLRQKIDEGLRQCTHFVVLLTPQSVNKPWVNTEIDAGLIRKIEQQARFIPLRFELSAEHLSPLLKTMLSPEITNFDRDITKLIHRIHGVSDKPPLGEVPAFIAMNPNNTGYSAAANRVAEIFVRQSKTGVVFDPNIRHEALPKESGLDADDLEDALHELQNFIKNERYGVSARDELFVEFDEYFMGWKPSDDALQLATRMMNEENFPREPAKIAELFGWSARRLNPAINFLNNRKLARILTALQQPPWAAILVEKNDATRRFVKSRS
jgi:TIR domain